MKLIDADKLIKTIQEHSYLMLNENWNERDYAMTVTGIEQAIAEQSGLQWILCTERMPEERQEVLLLMPHNMVIGFWEDVLCEGRKTWYANTGDGYFTDMDILNGYNDPIAWMPLPER